MNGEIITHLIEKLILRTFPPLSFWHSSYTKSDLSYHNFYSPRNLFKFLIYYVFHLLVFLISVILLTE